MRFMVEIQLLVELVRTVSLQGRRNLLLGARNETNGMRLSKFCRCVKQRQLPPLDQRHPSGIEFNYFIE